MKLSKENLAQIFKALGDPTRISIVEMLSVEEKCVCEIMEELEMTQPAISHHLKTLKQAGLIKDRREGKWIFYSLNHTEYKNLLDFINTSLGFGATCYECEERKSPKIECTLPKGGI